MNIEQIKQEFLSCFKTALKFSKIGRIDSIDDTSKTTLKEHLRAMFNIDIVIWNYDKCIVEYKLTGRQNSSFQNYELFVKVSYAQTVSGAWKNENDWYLPLTIEITHFVIKDKSKMITLSVQEVIDRLMQVKDKSKPCYIWINSQDPEPHYTGGDRIPIVNVDDLENFNVIDICCEHPVIQNGAANDLLQVKDSIKSGV